MIPVSVIIITKNEAGVIASCINAVQSISDDILIIDNDSTDNTTEIARKLGCRVYHDEWDGYGANKNKGIGRAKYNWILSIDADEIADTELVRALHKLALDDPKTVYDIKFRSYYGKKLIRFGSWGRDHHIRLFNRTKVKWSNSPVHETLVLPEKVTIKRLEGHLHHYSVKDAAEFRSKADHYAKLSAGKYLAINKKPSFIKLHIAPLFHFIKNYIVFLGFLDGKAGWEIARIISNHTRLKYRLLKEQPENIYTEVPKVKDNLVVEY
ncbi:MAG TPA: glycosyltransferase family 2 protein [Mucilaginibacter sp.]|jgi:glycosyltransferase involved in cell wall biosynthesis|nr:glycosyltransferase family 2 protein [Mucilaginibacter sp.]